MIVTENLISATTVCILTLLLCLTSRVSSEYESREISNGGLSDGRPPSNDFSSCSEGKCMKRTQEITRGMWFGPRLGKRRRSDGKQEVNSEALANILDGVRWAVITIPADEKRQSTKFTPRLGRGSEEDLLYEDAIDKSEIDNDRLLPPMFAPHLERRLSWAPSPRLGRQLRNILQKM